MVSLSTEILYSEQVQAAMRENNPIVALESTVITHGLPHPENAKLAKELEQIIRDENATPATIAVLDGQIHAGLSEDEIDILAALSNARKISIRDFAGVISTGASGGTTVAGTILVAEIAGIRVFATGGIGGVHRQPNYDISADLTQLARSQVIVVCAGVKSILDLPSTLEYLETIGVPVVGYKTDEFPAFYSRQSGLPVSEQADSPEEVVDLALTHWGLGIKSSMLLVVPPPKHSAIPKTEIDQHIETALQLAKEQNVLGQSITPFLLRKVSELTGGKSLRTNLSLLKNNAHIAAQVAVQLNNRKTI